MCSTSISVCITCLISVIEFLFPAFTNFLVYFLPRSKFVQYSTNSIAFVVYYEYLSVCIVFYQDLRLFSILPTFEFVLYSTNIWICFVFYQHLSLYVLYSTNIWISFVFYQKLNLCILYSSNILVSLYSVRLLGYTTYVQLFCKWISMFRVIIISVATPERCPRIFQNIDIHFFSLH